MASIPRSCPRAASHRRSKRWPAGPLHVGKFTIHDHENFGASLNVPEALIHSSNIVTAQVGDQLGGVRLKAAMERLGFNERPHIELQARGFPLWHKGEWPRLTTMTVSFGHGIALTPLQYRVLVAFVQHADRVLSPEQLLELAWNDSNVGVHRVKTYVAYLRQSFREAVDVELPIETVRGFGYRYKPPKSADELA